MKKSQSFYAQEIVRSEVAQNGKVTERATRAYVEGRMSYATFQKNIKVGMAQYRRRQ
jgi:hypothetical protein